MRGTGTNRTVASLLHESPGLLPNGPRILVQSFRTHMNGERSNQPASDGSSYPLSPTQLAMAAFVLTHDATGTTHGFDTEQLHVTLKYDIELSSLREAWNLVTRHHAILSTSIGWRGTDVLFQRTHEDVEVPIRTVTLDPERPSAIQTLLDQDRAEGFQLDRPPLQRVTVLATPLGVNQLVWTVHHILLDGRSFEPILADVFSVYEQLLAGVTTPHVDARRPFRDYITSLAQHERAQTSAEFVEGVLTHPVEPALVEFASLVEHSNLAPRVAEFASSTNVSRTTVLAAAWALTLARAAANTDVLFSLSRLGRSGLNGEAKHMIGPFTTTVPLRLEVRSSETVGAFLRGVYQRVRALSTIGESSLLDTGSLPESHLLFDDSDPEVDIPRSARLRSHIHSVRVHERPTFPLTLSVHLGTGFRVTLAYQTQRCSETLAARLLKSFLHNLEALTDAPEAQLSSFDGVPPADRRLQLQVWAGTSRDFPRDDLIHAPFLRRCALAPHAIALEYQGVHTSYAELDAQSNRLAHYLRECGVGAKSVVAIHMCRSPLLVASLLAVVKLGAIYVAVDPKYPASRRRFMFEDCGARLILTDASTHEQSVATALNVQSDKVRDALATQAPTPLGGGSRSEDTCYIMYTSGSTGQPKGAVLTHRAVNNTLDWVNRSFSVGDQDKILFVNSPSFDLSVYDIFGTLGAGGTIHIPHVETKVDPAALAHTLTHAGITVWNSTPSYLQLLLQFLPAAPTDTLRLILLSGDWIPLPLVAALRERFPKATLVSLGGATEAAIWSNSYTIGGIAKHWRSVPYGWPIQNCQYYILGDDLQLVPIGTAGELFIGGECVASGYLNREELTAFRFPINPFGSGRLYRTGDLCRYLDGNGTIEILGRKDNQVKIRGFRVELGEVEQALVHLPRVEAAACVTTRDASNELSIVAFVVPSAGSQWDEALLHEQLSERLPDFMLPARFVRLKALPISSTGKVDRRALRPPVDAPTAPAATAQSDEERVVDIWQRLLGRRAIRTTDDFFELGGHSLLAIQLIKEVNDMFGVEVHLGTLFEHRTPEQLAKRIAVLRARRTSESWTSLVPIQPTGDQPVLFCVAGAGGSPVRVRNVAVELGNTQPVYGIQLRLMPANDGPVTIEHIATSILSDLRASEFKGPYFLAGFSAGGVIAHELARQLQRQGETVALLVLLDAFNPTLGRWSTWERTKHFVAMFRAYGAAYSCRRLLTRARKVMSSFWGFRHPELAAIQAQVTNAVDNHVPQPYSGATLLVRTAAKPIVDVDYRTDPSNGWGSILTKLNVVTVPGRHDDLLTQQAVVVAAHVREALNRAQVGTGSPREAVKGSRDNRAAAPEREAVPA